MPLQAHRGHDDYRSREGTRRDSSSRSSRGYGTDWGCDNRGRSGFYGSRYDERRTEERTGRYGSSYSSLGNEHSGRGHDSYRKREDYGHPRSYRGYGSRGDRPDRGSRSNHDRRYSGDQERNLGGVDRRRGDDRNGGGGGEQRRGARRSNCPNYRDKARVSGSGYENIGNRVVDPRVHEEWTGRVGPREVRDEDPAIGSEVSFCRPPVAAPNSCTTQLSPNYVSLALVSSPVEIFKYHAIVERLSDRGPSIDRNRESEAANLPSAVPPTHEARSDHPLPRTLVRKVINATLRQYEGEFTDLRFVVHDGMSALYSPTKLPWNSKNFTNVKYHHPGVDGEAARRDRRTFVVQVKWVEAISVSRLKDYYSNPAVNVRPVLQAIDVVTHYLASQRLATVGHDLFTLKDSDALKGGKEICWGCHQAIHLGTVDDDVSRVEDVKLLLNVDQATAIIYSAGPLSVLVAATLQISHIDSVRNLSEREVKYLARALRRIEVEPTHRKDCPRRISGLSAESADRTLITIKGEEKSVSEYFLQRYKMHLRYPNLPCLNVGGKNGKEEWLPIEKTCRPPEIRKKTVLKHIRQAGFENDPYLEAFGLKVDEKFVKIKAHVLDPPAIKYRNTPPNGRQEGAGV